MDKNKVREGEGYPELGHFLQEVSKEGEAMLKIIEREDIVFNGKGGKMEKMAFTLYVEIVGLSMKAKLLIEDGVGNVPKGEGMGEEEIVESFRKCLPNTEDVVNEYEYRGDVGDYTPNEKEQELIFDCVEGLWEFYIKDEVIKLAKALSSHFPKKTLVNPDSYNKPKEDNIDCICKKVSNAPCIIHKSIPKKMSREELIKILNTFVGNSNAITTEEFDKLADALLKEEV